MSLLTQVVDELKKENSKLKEESQKMKKETEESKKESFIVKRQNEELKGECQQVKENNERIQNENSAMKEQLANMHRLVVKDEYSLLPVTISFEKETHFYSNACGHHISIKRCFRSRYISFIAFKVYKCLFGTSLPLISEIVFKYRNETHRITKDTNCQSYDDEEGDDGVVQEFITNVRFNPRDRVIDIISAK
jgi:FtsZ-binding cell division protein ZapB